MNKMTIEDVSLNGKRVFIRVDFNVPMDDDGNITDDRRIRSSLSSINYCIDHGAKVILASHLGRPKGTRNPKFSLDIAAKRLNRLLNKEVRFAPDCVGEKTRTLIDSLREGEVLLLENLRFHPGEEANDEGFSRELARGVDVYVNNAFGTAHRAHASTCGITRFVPVSAAGFLMKKEIEYFEGVITNPVRPFVAILGGSKVSGKLGVIKNLIDRVDTIIIGGGMMFTFLKATRHEVENSIVEEDMIEFSLEMLQRAREKGVKFYLPVDVVAADRVDAQANTKIVTVQEMPKGWHGLDIGPASSKLFELALQGAKTIVWNGPMGVYEFDAFSRGTTSLTHAVARCYATTIICGGDTADAVNRAGEADNMTFISTGGGASLKLLEGKSLPGIEGLTDKKA
jgi:phosphoglycerate kinase